MPPNQEIKIQLPGRDILASIARHLMTHLIKEVKKVVVAAAVEATVKFVKQMGNTMVMLVEVAGKAIAKIVDALADSIVKVVKEVGGYIVVSTAIAAAMYLGGLGHLVVAPSVIVPWLAITVVVFVVKNQK